MKCVVGATKGARVVDERLICRRTREGAPSWSQSGVGAVNVENEEVIRTEAGGVDSATVDVDAG